MNASMRASSSAKQSSHSLRDFPFGTRLGEVDFRPLVLNEGRRDLVENEGDKDDSRELEVRCHSNDRAGPPRLMLGRRCEHSCFCQGMRRLRRRDTGNG